MKQTIPDYQGAERAITDTLDQRLPKDLFYHGLHHTRDVYGAAMQIARSEHISPEELNLLKIATMFHDAGFITHYKNHEEAGCEMARAMLPAFGFGRRQIRLIEGMIMATQIPQSPRTQLERIICDADLDYLGRDDFRDIAKTLFDELKVYMNMKDEKVWNQIQLDFLRNHQYHTAYSRQHREAKKQQHLSEIIRIVESYSPLETSGQSTLAKKKAPAKKVVPSKSKK